MRKFYIFTTQVCFPVAIFFFLMSLIMIEVRSSKDIRGPIQNGFWLWKYLLVIAGIICSAIWMPGGRQLNQFSCKLAPSQSYYSVFELQIYEEF